MRVFLIDPLLSADRRPISRASLRDRAITSRSRDVPFRNQQTPIPSPPVAPGDGDTSAGRSLLLTPTTGAFWSIHYS
jgi:hypothetical protein